MSTFTFMRLFALLYTFVSIRSIAAAPVAPTVETRHSLSKRPSTFVASAPHFTIYNDKWLTLPSAEELTGYNVFALSFWLLSGPADQAINWAQLTSDQKSSIKSAYNAAGISLIVSAFGSTDEPTTSGADPTATAQSLASWVIAQGLDGVDVDYEDDAAFDKGDGSAEQWLITFTTALRTALPTGQYIISHAPQAPWFAPVPSWGGGGYLLVDQKVGSSIDFYNVQFYNQGASEYTDCTSLLTASSSAWPQTALFQIIASGVAADKLLIGKPGTSADASNGYMDTTTLASCVAQAARQSWSGGVMVWQFPDAGSPWIEAVRGTTFPLSGGASAPAPTSSSTIVRTSTRAPASTSATPTSVRTSTRAPASTSVAPTSTTSTAAASGTPSPNGCNGVAAWTAADAYNGGAKVTFSGHLWIAAWWTEDDSPGDGSGVWTDGADPRLALLSDDLFTGKRVLDVGCNEGWVTCEIAQSWGASHVLGVDIDEVLIRGAWRRRRVAWSLQAPEDIPTVSEGRPSKRARLESSAVPNYFPASFEHTYGPVSIPPYENTRKHIFPHNVSFRTADWVHEDVPEDQSGYDVVIAFSISKWIHLNGGDDAIAHFFRRVYDVLAVRGVFVLETQPWDTYAKARKMDKACVFLLRLSNAFVDAPGQTLQENAKSLKLRPSDFEGILKDIGFGSAQKLGTTGEGLVPSNEPVKPAHFDIERVIRPNILALHPYRCARDDYQSGILLDANENALGHSIPSSSVLPSTVPELDATLNLNLHRYPDPSHDEIKSRLASLASIPDSKHVFLGVGSDEVIDLLMRVCVAPGGKEKILITPPTYGMYAVTAQVNDVGLVKVPLELTGDAGEGGERGRFSVRVDEVKRSIDADPSIKLIFLCSPGNPTGTLIPLSTIREILDYENFKGIVIVDEAYIDFSRPGSSATSLVADYANLCVMQTLSKSYGLAAIRLGVAFAQPPLIQVLTNTKAPYNISTPTAHLAMAALTPPAVALMQSKIRNLLASRAALTLSLAASPFPELGVGKPIGLPDANFIVVPILNKLSRQPDNERAHMVYQTLAETMGVVVRFRGKELGCEGCLRITIGTEEETKTVLAKLEEVLGR
ncbi:hypothetical protein HWV62_38975 [Athelia sp. TMB]|nr:hypothetical protein HWV62_38975 [Athelia sp. TMB]